MPQKGQLQGPGLEATGEFEVVEPDRPIQMGDDVVAGPLDGLPPCRSWGSLIDELPLRQQQQRHGPVDHVIDTKQGECGGLVEAGVDQPADLPQGSGKGEPAAGERYEPRGCEQWPNRQRGCCTGHTPRRLLKPDRIEAYRERRSPACLAKSRHTGEVHCRATGKPAELAALDHGRAPAAEGHHQRERV